MKFFIFFLATIILLPSNVKACQGPSYEYATFLRYLPITAFNRDVIALVEINSVENARKRISYVTVLESIKNTQKGDVFKIEELQLSCLLPHDLNIGEKFYVAGEVNEGKEFSGIWKSKDTRMGLW